MPTTVPTSPRLGWVILYVPDVARAVAFYGSAFGLRPRFVHASGTYAELDTGATALAFVDETADTVPSGFAINRADGKAAGVEIALVVDDVPAAYAHAVAQGAQAVVPPVEKPWGQTVSFVRDLDGVLVELCTPVG